MESVARAFLSLLLVLLLSIECCALTPHFYCKTCPRYEEVVLKVVAKHLKEDADTAPDLLRLQFHDCFIRGCDGSVLLNSTNGIPAEKDAIPNKFLGGFDVIDEIKRELEASRKCRGKVSCSDILATAARDAVFLSSNVSWEVNLGRRDGNISLASDVIPQLPSPFENATELINKFQARGFTAEEMTLLQGGGHSVGTGHCGVFLSRLGGADPTLNSNYAKKLAKQCRGDPNNEVHQDPVSPDVLDNQSFKNVKAGKGLFNSDEDLFFDRRTRATILKYAKSNAIFTKDFRKAMTKLTQVGILTGQQGTIRKNCAVPN